MKTKEETINSHTPQIKVSRIDGDVYSKQTVLACMQEYSDQEAINFGAWYSGMTPDKVKRAYERYLRERGLLIHLPFNLPHNILTQRNHDIYSPVCISTIWIDGLLQNKRT